MQVTVCGKIKDTSLYAVLDATSHLMDKVERLYFKERYIKHADRNGLKRLFLKEYGITGRQLNGIILNLSGSGSQQASAPSQSGDQEEEVGQGRQAYQVCAEERQEGLV